MANILHIVQPHFLQSSHLPINLVPSGLRIRDRVQIARILDRGVNVISGSPDKYMLSALEQHVKSVLDCGKPTDFLVGDGYRTVQVELGIDEGKSYCKLTRTPLFGADRHLHFFYDMSSRKSLQEISN